MTQGRLLCRKSEVLLLPVLLEKGARLLGLCFEIVAQRHMWGILARSTPLVYTLSWEYCNYSSIAANARSESHPRI